MQMFNLRIYILKYNMVFSINLCVMTYYITLRKGFPCIFIHARMVCRKSQHCTILLQQLNFHFNVNIKFMEKHSYLVMAAFTFCWVKIPTLKTVLSLQLLLVGYTMSKDFLNRTLHLHFGSGIYFLDNWKSTSRA